MAKTFPGTMLDRMSEANAAFAKLPAARRWALLGASLAIAAAIWLPTVHLFFKPRFSDVVAENGLSPNARAVAAAQLGAWSDPARRAAELKKMRASNAEWDFMGRTFLVLSLANMALREPETKAERLAIIDAVIDETLKLEREHGMFFFLMSYARESAFIDKPARSLFIDGEIGVMLAARRLVEEREDFKAPLAERCAIIEASLRRHPTMLAESYPNECWLFDHLLALDALKMADALDGSDHSALIEEWIELAKRKKTHDKTGLLFASMTLEGVAMDGPEGTTLWLAAHALQILDPGFARDQYERARREIGVSVCGFGYAREWPRSWKGPADIDSGPTIPIVGASAGSSGLALVGAAAFGDREWLAELAAALNFAAFPEERDGELRYCASNQVGDAVMLYALTLGPLWDAVIERGKK